MEMPVETKQAAEHITIASLRFERQMEILQQATLPDFMKGAAEVAHYSSLGCLGPAMAWMQIEHVRNRDTEESITRRVRSYFKEGLIHLYYDDVLDKTFNKQSFTTIHVSYNPYGEEEPLWELEQKSFDEPTKEVQPFSPTPEQEAEFRAHVIEAFERRREENIRRCRQLGSRAHLIVVQPNPAYI